MSFSRQVKQEITAKEAAAPCCVTAACYGIACFGRYFDTRGLVLHTENAFIAQWAKNMYQKAGVLGKVYVKGAGKGSTYEFSIKGDFETEKMLAMFGHTGDETTLRIHRDNLICGGCLAHFTAAAFLCCGTMSNPEKDYNMEFVHSRYKLMEDFQLLLQEHDFALKHTQRKGANVLYLRASEQIEDMLTFMGAGHAALEIMNLKVYKDFRNRANRITNCETANIDKIVSAGGRALAAIRVLEKHGALETLPPQLYEAAVLRRKNPDLSLTELAAMMTEPVSKSGLNHRLQKICALADSMAQREKDIPAAQTE